jgi:hypothetical protein
VSRNSPEKRIVLVSGGLAALKTRFKNKKAGLGAGFSKLSNIGCS